MRRASRWAAGLLAALMAAPAPMTASAHNGVVHKNAAEASAHRAEEASKPKAGVAALPVTPEALFPKGIGGAFELTDQDGRKRDQRDPDGRPQLLFFGYASCEAICSVAMPSMAKAAAQLEEEGLLVTPLLITVDPENDTPAAMKKALPKVHPRYVGLTGSPEALAAAYKTFQVESREVARTPEGAPIFSHGSFIYLMDAEGRFLTLMPPILDPERIAEIVKGYVAKGGDG